ncbi:hypothetical protein B0H16DRAFT_1477323 [Mycena metata]|uniref:Uncharacterized protein n=1 Tax=Mycena metata TaxID=1033252 RepID=A0AAD7HA78_9AGAR|nr:hypothetical protein B0H16DRAFT_1477323 [Mycena metata]
MSIDPHTQLMPPERKWTPPVDHRETLGQFDPTVHNTTGINVVINHVLAAAVQLPEDWPFSLNMNSGKPLGIGNEATWANLGIATLLNLLSVGYNTTDQPTGAVATGRDPADNSSGLFSDGQWNPTLAPMSHLVGFDGRPPGKLLPTRGTLFLTRPEAVGTYAGKSVILNFLIFLLPFFLSGLGVLLGSITLANVSGNIIIPPLFPLPPRRTNDAGCPASSITLLFHVPTSTQSDMRETQAAFAFVLRRGRRIGLFCSNRECLTSAIASDLAFPASPKKRRRRRKQRDTNSDPEDQDFGGSETDDSDSDIEEVIPNDEIAASLPTKSMPATAQRRSKPKATEGPPKKKGRRGKGKSKEQDDSPASEPDGAADPSGSAPPPKAHSGGKTRNAIYLFYEEEKRATSRGTGLLSPWRGVAWRTAVAR